MEALKIGIVGIGNMGSAHFSCINSGEIEGLCVTALCDTDVKRLDWAKSINPSVSVFTDFGEMLKNADMDGVLIATPHPFHAYMGIKALESGRHILVEKPIDISVSDALKLNEAAEKSGKIFGIMFNQRTNSLFAEARRIVTSGELGQLKRTVWIVTNWYRTQSYYNSGSWRATWAGEGGGVLLNQAPHNLDLWQWICGMPKSVTAHCNVAKYHDIEVEDEAILYTEYENGATGVFITSTGDYPGTNRLEIIGTKGKIVIENGILRHWTLKFDERELCFASDESSCSTEVEYSEINTVKETAHKGILQNFTNSVLKGEGLIAPGIEGINELTLSNAAYLSQWQGNKKIELPLDCEKFDSLLKGRAEKSGFKAEGCSHFSKEYSDRWQVRW